MEEINIIENLSTPIKVNKEIVYCKDYIHRPYVNKNHKVCAPQGNDGYTDYTCPFICDDSYYNRAVDDDFFCGYGEKNYVLLYS